MPELNPDITVAADGSGNFKTVQEALASIPRDNRERKIIFIRDGVYREKIRIDAPCVTLRGQSRKGTRIEFSQLGEDFKAKPDEIGQAVANIVGDDAILENLTIANTAGIVGQHAFAIYIVGNQTVIVDCDVLSDGADTLAMWRGKDGDKPYGYSYHARCNFRGAVDFICPRGWCYICDSTFFETNVRAAISHDGQHDAEMKFVLRNCRFDGVEGWYLARHHHDGQFFLIDCTFAKTMIDRAPYRVTYPLDGGPPTEESIARNKELDATNIWGERNYYSDCRRLGGDYGWHADNLAKAKGSPRADEMTAKWTFGGKWDPENEDGPEIVAIGWRGKDLAIIFMEDVTVKGKPWVKLRDGTLAHYLSGSGTETILFGFTGDLTEIVSGMEIGGGAIIASQASEKIRVAELILPGER